MTVEEIVDQIWAHPSRTVDAGSPAPSDGSVIDDIGYAVWTYITRTVEGGINRSFLVSESTLAPVQAITADTKLTVDVIVSELTPTPSQSAIAETSGGVKPVVGGGAWDYYAPIYKIRTDIVQSVPAPTQRAKAANNRPSNGSQSAPKPEQRATAYYFKPVYEFTSVSVIPLPYQTCEVWPHRLAHVREEEERKIMLMLLGFEDESFELLKPSKEVK